MDETQGRCQAPARLEMSVRAFVEPLELAGDLHDGAGARASAGFWAQRGSEIHVLLQEERTSGSVDYECEVTVAGERASEGLPTLALLGRIDGLKRIKGAPVLEEIKSTVALDRLEQELAREPEHPYRMQLLVYGWLWWRRTGEIPRCRLWLVSLHDIEDRREIEVPFDASGMEAWVASRHAALAARDLERRDREAARALLARKLPFPFPDARPGQAELVDAVAVAARSRGRLVIQAPTGLGKTAGALFPMLKDALASGKQVFFTTPKNSQHGLALEVVQRLRRQGHPVKACILTAKDKACLLQERLCHPKACPFAKGYYDKLKEHRVLELLEARGALGPEDFAELGREFEVCPFELALDVAARMDVIVCDYNYVFHPENRLQRYFGEDSKAHAVNLVIDEAHNLYSRAQDYDSPVLSEAAFDGLLARAKEIPGKTRTRFRKWAKEAKALIASYADDGTPHLAAPEPEPFEELRLKILNVVVRYFEERELVPPSDPALEAYRLWTDFRRVQDLRSDAVVATARRRESGSELKLTCCDASAFLAERLRGMAAVVAVSATIKPFPFYVRMSGFGEGCDTAEFDSPFPPERQKVLVIPQVSTALRDRDRDAPRIAEILNRVTPLRQGNYMAFFPSFDLLEKVAPHVSLPGMRVWKQERGMPPAAQRALLSRFEEAERNNFLLAVQGGSFSEGVDLPGDRLIGAFIVGPGLPAFTLEREWMRRYFDERGGGGSAFAYTYPAMTKVVQAAGRVVRSMDDRGLVVLIDRRFAQGSYVSTFPATWLRDGFQELLSKSIINDIKYFWQSVAVPQ